MTATKSSSGLAEKPLVSGIIAAASPLPLLAFTALWCWTWSFGIGAGLLKYDAPFPQWLHIVSLAPILFSPLLGLMGMIHGIIKRTIKWAWLGILLSVLCLIENALLLSGIIILAGRY